MKRGWTDEQVVEMRTMWRSGLMLKQIAAQFGAKSVASVHRAVTGETYKLVPNPVTGHERKDAGRMGSNSYLAAKEKRWGDLKR